MKRFFNCIFYNLYSDSVKVNASPEIPVITFLSFCQANNVLTVLNVIFYLANFHFEYKIHYYYFVIQVVIVIFNNFYYLKLKKLDTIITKNEYSLGKKKYLVDVYGLFSLGLTLFTYYVYRNF